MSALSVLLVTESVPSVRTTIWSGGRLSTIVERKVNFPEIGPTVAEIIPSNVLSSICLTSSMPGKQVENLLISIKKSHASWAGTPRSIFPSKIIVYLSPGRNSGRSYVRNPHLTSAEPVLENQPCSAPCAQTAQP